MINNNNRNLHCEVGFCRSVTDHRHSTSIHSLGIAFPVVFFNNPLTSLSAASFLHNSLPDFTSYILRFYRDYILECIKMKSSKLGRVTHILYSVSTDLWRETNPDRNWREILNQQEVRPAACYLRK